MQNRYRTVHPANASKFVAHRQTRAKSSRHCSMVAVLFVREYICKLLAAVWVCELVPYYAPRGWRIKCVSKSAWEKKHKSKTKTITKNRNCFALTKHKFTRHQNQHLTVLGAHYQQFLCLSLEEILMIAINILFEQLLKIKLRIIILYPHEKWIQKKIRGCWFQFIL